MGFGYLFLSPAQRAAVESLDQPPPMPNWWKTATRSGNEITFDNAGTIQIPPPGGSTGAGGPDGDLEIKNVDGNIYVDGRLIANGQTLQGQGVYQQAAPQIVNKGHTKTAAEMEAELAARESPDTQQDITGKDTTPAGMSTGAKVLGGVAAVGLAFAVAKKLKRKK